MLDMMAVDMFDSVKMKFDVVQKGLLDTLMTKEILKDDRYVQCYAFSVSYIHK